MFDKYLLFDKYLNCGPSKFDVHFQPLIDAHGDADVTWHRWQYIQVERDGSSKHLVSCVLLTTTLKVLIEELQKDLGRLPEHLMRATWQHQQLGMCIDSLKDKPNHATVFMDYAKITRQQNEVQSAILRHHTSHIVPNDGLLCKR